MVVMQRYKAGGRKYTGDIRLRLQIGKYSEVGNRLPHRK